LDNPLNGRESALPGSSPRTRVRRIPANAVLDTAALHQVLDAGLVAHVAVIDDGQPFVIPVAYARRGNDVIFHGSSASRLFTALASGQPTCLTVTLLDGLVLARSAFESSMNYRSAMVIGVARRLEGDDELDALRVVSEHLIPGRWQEIRHPAPKERAATITLALSLDECSVKIRSGGPEDVPSDLTDPEFSRVWAGDIPLRESFGDPIPDNHTPAETPVPQYVLDWQR